MYVAVKGGERAIENAHAWLAEERRGDTSVPELSVAQIREQLSLAVNRVMAEGSLYDPDLAALAIKQARGDLIEAIFLIRAYRTTLPRLGCSRPIDTGRMAAVRRVSATYKDLPGGQVLGPTFDYTHRLIDFALAAEGGVAQAPVASAPLGPVPFVIDWGATTNPAGTSPGGCSLVELHCCWPEPGRLQELHQALSINSQILRGEPAVFAVIDTPHGRVDIR